MTYCLNPNCNKPHNPDQNKFCQNCGQKLLLGKRYRAIEKIGEGGFGKTFLAIDEYKPYQPKCVIKQFAYQGKGTKIAFQLFVEEAKRLEELGKHPQIPDLLAHFEQNKEKYLVQEFIEGKNLAEELKENGVFTQDKIIELLLSILNVLSYIHKNNVIHRDIKPENIIYNLNTKEFILVDFGIAKFVNPNLANSSATIVGTPGYSADEQMNRKPVFASDIYSLGVTCIHLLTNVDPFTLYSDSENKWVWRDYLNNNYINDNLAKIIDKVIQKDVDQRYQLADEIIEDLRLNILQYVIESLSSDYKEVIAEQLFGKNNSITYDKLNDEIYKYFTDYTKKQIKKTHVTDWDIILLWRDYILVFIEKLKLPNQFQKDKNDVIKKLKQLQDDSKLTDNLEKITQDIFSLFYETLTEKEKEKLWEQIEKELKEKGFEFNKNKYKKAGFKGFAYGAAGIPFFFIFLIARILLQKMTQGILAWILVTILGRQAFKRAALGFLSGPFGIAIGVALGGGAIITGVSQYKKEIKKAKFIEGILSVYFLSFYIKFENAQ
jgi:serine/threonine protein kinase